ncbi:uncharacterized protein BDV17DRAFT_292745 [Aspergillus undulatus]|uniref:uncharacterized protein n=1 Tax=Aspergillus undulatus TaxID=1810928 RepID=UPI003CCE4735
MRTLLKINGQSAVDAPLMFTTILLIALLPFNFSSLSSATTIFDIASSSPDQNVYQTLWQEAAQHIQTEEDWSNLASFANMPYTESAAKESLRLNPSQTCALNQTVVQESGLTLPSGQHVAKGTWLAVASMTIHHDDRFYPEAETYKPFRFVKGVSRTNAAGDSTDAALDKPVVSYIVTHYDIEPLTARPKNWEIADTVLPPQDAVVRVRRVPGR